MNQNIADFLENEKARQLSHAIEIAAKEHESKMYKLETMKKLSVDHKEFLSKQITDKSLRDAQVRFHDIETDQAVNQTYQRSSNIVSLFPKIQETPLEIRKDTLKQEKEKYKKELEQQVKEREALEHREKQRAVQEF